MEQATRRRRERPHRVKDALEQAPWEQPRYRLPHIEPLPEDAVEAIHQTALEILERIGMRILLPEGRALLAKAGAKVDEDSLRVYIGHELIEDALSKAPASFKLHARNPGHDLVMGGDYVAYGTVGGPPYCSDIERGRRPGTLEDFRAFMKLAQSFNAVHIVNMPVEPLDITVPFRHLETARAMLTLTDKLAFVFAHSQQRVLDVLEMVRIARGISEEQLRAEPSLYTIVNTNSPLQLDVPMTQGIIDMARWGQVTAITPFTLAGAMAPITLPGAIAQQTAEFLAGLVIAQLAKPGAPIIYGGFTSNVDMRSGAPAFGTPEYTLAAQISGQLARRYKLPFRSSNVNASNAPDVQAAYESMMATWGAITGGVNFLLHGMGWLEGGLCASFEKFVIDVEMLQMMTHYMRPLVVDKETLAFEAVQEVGPAGHFFGAAHTLARYETAFYKPLLSDWRNFESWRGAGAVEATERAHHIYKRVIETFEPPPMDPAIAEELDAFVARRTAEGGAPIT